MKSKSIKLFATAILATAAIGVTTVTTQTQVFASEVTQVKNPNGEGVLITYETDAVFDTYEQGEAYLQNYIQPKIDSITYSIADAQTIPDGIGGKYLVTGRIFTSDTAASSAKAAAEEIVANAGKNNVAPQPKPEPQPQPQPQPKPDNGKTDDKDKVITATFDTVEVSSGGLTFEGHLSEALPHGTDRPDIIATLTDKQTGKQVYKSDLILEGLTKDLDDQFTNSILYSNKFKGYIAYEIDKIPAGDYVLTVSGSGYQPLGTNADKQKRVFTVSKDVTIPAKNGDTNKPQPEPKPQPQPKPKPEPQPDTKPNKGKDDKDQIKPDTKPGNNKTDDKNQGKPDNNKTGNKKQDKPNTQPETNKSKTLPNTGETTSLIGLAGIVLAGVGALFVVKRKRG